MARIPGERSIDAALTKATSTAERGMARHLSLAELQAGYRTSGDVALARHYQVIWLLAQGRSCAETAALTSFARRWVEQLLARYNAFGPSSLGDRRRGNGAKARLLTPEVIDKLRQRLKTPPDDGGVWTAKKVAAFLAAELGLAGVAEQRGWEALRAIGWRSRQRDEDAHDAAAAGTGLGIEMVARLTTVERGRPGLATVRYRGRLFGEETSAQREPGGAVTVGRSAGCDGSRMAGHAAGTRMNSPASSVMTLSRPSWR